MTVNSPGVRSARFRWHTAKTLPPVDPVDDEPIFLQVRVGVDGEMDDFEVGESALKIVQIHRLELSLVIEIGFIREGVGFVVLGGAFGDLLEGILLGAAGLLNDEDLAVFGCDLGGPVRRERVAKVASRITPVPEATVSPARRNISSYTRCRFSTEEASFTSKISSCFRISFLMMSVLRMGYPFIRDTTSMVSVLLLAGSPQAMRTGSSPY